MKVKGVVELRKKICRVVGFFHRSTTANALLKSAQIGLKPNLPPRKLIQDVETRWNSSCDMMTSFVEQRAAVSATLVLKELKLKDKEGLTLKDAEFETVEEVIKLLAPFKKATTALCSETYPTVSLIFSMKKMLLSLLEPKSTDSDPVVKEVKEIMLADLRYEGPDIESYLLEASLLDPRFKTLPYATVEQRNVVYENLKLKMTTRGMVNVKVKQEDINDQERSSDSDMPQLTQLLILPGDEELVSDEEVTTISVKESVSKDNTNNCSALDDLFGDVFVTKVESSDDDKVLLEYNSYCDEPSTDLNSNPLEWWSTRKEKYPLIAHFARKVLVTQATSVASERVFSTAGDIVTAQRVRLSSDNVDKLIFLKKNLKNE